MSKIIQIYQDIVQSNQRISNVVQNNQDIVQNDQYRDIFQNNQNISIIYIVQNNHIYRDIVQNNQCISKYCPKIIKSCRVLSKKPKYIILIGISIVQELSN